MGFEIAGEAVAEEVVGEAVAGEAVAASSAYSAADAYALGAMTEGGAAAGLGSSIVAIAQQALISGGMNALTARVLQRGRARGPHGR